MNELQSKVKTIILISNVSGIISLFFPQWYLGLYLAINESIQLNPNVRESVLAISMFSISLLVIAIIGLLNSIKKIQNNEIYSLWATWVFIGILISFIPTYHISMLSYLFDQFWAFSIFGLEFFFSYFSGATAFIAGLVAFFTSSH